MTGKRCVVAYATAQQQYLWTVDLPPQGTIADALQVARGLAESEGGAAGDFAARIPWDEAPVGIFGELRNRQDLPADGDRIEIYRSLRNDPRERRRQQVQHARRNPLGPTKRR